MEILEHLAQAKQVEYVIALIGLFGYIAFWRVLNGGAKETQSAAERLKAPIERIAGFMVPEDVMFHPGHAWARVEGNDIVTVGMDDFAAKLVGSVDSIYLPKEGSKVKQGSCGWQFKVDSRAVHMLSPVGGEVVEVNEAVLDSPALAFEDPYGKGWLLKVRSNNLGPNLRSMIPVNLIANWFESIRENLSSRQPAHALGAMYQDGGEPVSGIAKTLDPQNWDELAREFFLTK